MKMKEMVMGLSLLSIGTLMTGCSSNESMEQVEKDKQTEVVSSEATVLADEKENLTTVKGEFNGFSDDSLAEFRIYKDDKESSLRVFEVDKELKGYLNSLNSEEDKLFELSYQESTNGIKNPILVKIATE